MTVWIAVTSAARARIFESAGRNQPLIEYTDLVNPEDRLSKKEFRSGEPGRTADVQRGQRHTIGMTDNPKDQLAKEFAAIVSKHLAKGLSERRFQRLCIVAPPRFLGMLRAQMTTSLKATLAGEIRKDLTAEDQAAIYDQVAPVLWPRTPPIA
jgi:protein required for attachment to host cells